MERTREGEDLRCAFCHGALGGEQVVCGGCDTRLHPDCRADLDRCPTIGCAGVVPSPRLTPAQRANRRVAALVALPFASLLAIMITLPAAFGSPRPGLPTVQGGWGHESADMPALLDAARALMSTPDLPRYRLPDPRLRVEHVTPTHVVATWIETSGVGEVCGVVFLAPGEDASALRAEMPDAQTLEVWSGIWSFRAPRRAR